MNRSRLNRHRLACVRFEKRVSQLAGGIEHTWLLQGARVQRAEAANLRRTGRLGWAPRLASTERPTDRIYWTPMRMGWAA